MEKNPIIKEVEIPVHNEYINADIFVPPNPRGFIVFAHGSGSSKASTRNKTVAAKIQEEGFATVLADLLTEKENAIDMRTRQIRFNIPLLVDRVTLIIDWLSNPQNKIEGFSTAEFPIGIYGASTGAAAAIGAAEYRGQKVKAVISRGGRVDLAGGALPTLTAPTLLIVGSLDPDIVHLNRSAYNKMTLVDDKKFEVVHGASHLFEEKGKLEEVAKLSADWFSNFVK